MLPILQPFVPHYREKFFNGIKELMPVNIYCYEVKAIVDNNFEKGDVKIIPLRKIKIGPFLFYNPFPFLKSDSQTVVLMLDMSHISTWILLLTTIFHRKKIILWGHGISVKRYIKEEQRPSIGLKYMIKLANGIWFYTEKEALIWKEKFPNLKYAALNNTISDVDEILSKALKPKNDLKNKYNITQEIVLIFAARFNSEDRRVDLLVQTIHALDQNRYGFIIIGDGRLKPDFSSYKNVYDFGGLYNNEIKAELFSIADIYFQPGWVGLSIVEAMAYGKPIFTFKRSENIKQCVEYHYIKHGTNGFTFENVDEMIEKLGAIGLEEFSLLGKQAKNYVQKNLLLNDMVKRAVELIQS
ncbi:glycosyltransferase [Mucilaginibacter limnophilus]|uniref:Glycosyltransferase n=1 Tax=Mucilaginibacter limnophilus TaxID=1932778 RepID=A0A437MQ66_9SPHI|nr:glycosyltransferase [Mucilaginibacter limnophilus]RVT99755.1 glycosyltransferase [Mucilaginibacter limnophilus]